MPPLPARPSVLFPAAWVAVLAAAVAVRFAGLFDDLWLDEIWSLAMAEQAPSAAAVFTEIRHDNNHWLNTLYLYALGPGRPDPVYRLLSFVTGVGAVVVAGLAGREHGRLSGLLAAALVGLSYLPAHYASEARGYAPATFFALAGYHLLQRQAKAFRWGRAALFAAAAVLGLISHLTFVYVYAGLVAWSAIVVRGKPKGRAAAELAALHAGPVAAGLGLYLVSVKGMAIGGGVVSPIGGVLGQLIEWTFGAAGPGLAAAAVGAVVAALAAVGLVMSARAGDGEWVFFAVGCGVAPAALAVAGGRPDFYPRYFLLAATLLLVLLARVLARMIEGGGRARAVAVVALLGFAAGNAVHLRAFLRDGRGQYRAALAFCAEHTPPDRPVTIGGDHDFRNGLVIAYHRRSIPRPVEYVPAGRWAASPPLWLVVHSFAPPAPPPELAGPNGVPYRGVAVFPHYGASGWTWYVYRAV